MGNLTSHARRELKAAGLFKKESDYNGMIGTDVMELVEAFAKQEHSGFSAPLVLDIFAKVAAFEPLGPLTGEDDEWVAVTEGRWQNNRCSHVFKEAGGAYDIEGKIFREPNGSCTQRAESHVPVTFPYTPKTEYVDAPVEVAPTI